MSLFSKLNASRQASTAVNGFNQTSISRSGATSHRPSRLAKAAQTLSSPLQRCFSHVPNPMKSFSKFSCMSKVSVQTPHSESPPTQPRVETQLKFMPHIKSKPMDSMALSALQFQAKNIPVSQQQAHAELQEHQPNSDTLHDCVTMLNRTLDEATLPAALTTELQFLRNKITPMLSPSYEAPEPPSSETPELPSYESLVPPSYESLVPPSYESLVPPSYESLVPPSYESLVPPSYETPEPPSSEAPKAPSYEAPQKASTVRRVAFRDVPAPAQKSSASPTMSFHKNIDAAKIQLNVIMKEFKGQDRVDELHHFKKELLNLQQNQSAENKAKHTQHHLNELKGLVRKISDTRDPDLFTQAQRSIQLFEKKIDKIGADTLKPFVKDLLAIMSTPPIQGPTQGLAPGHPLGTHNLTDFKSTTHETTNTRLRSMMSKALRNDNVQYRDINAEGKMQRLLQKFDRNYALAVAHNSPRFPK